MSGYFIILWFGQFVSDLGSAMTGFAVTIWAFEQTGSALIVSLSGLLIVLPQMMGGALAGPLVDRMDKKAMILFTDVGQGLCSFMLFYLLWTGRLAIGHVYCLNFMGSLIGSFKAPATDVAISLLIPKEGYVRASGMRSFATGTVQVLSPMLAAVLLGFGGMLSVMMFDGLSMLFAVITLFAFVKIPRMERSGKRTFGLSNYVADLRSGMGTIKASRLLMTLLGFTAFVNLAAGLAYYSLLSPMILARSGNDANALAWVNAALGLGGVAGGVLVVILPPARSRIKTMFFCCGLSFLLGDILFSLGRSIPVWVFAGFFSNILIPPFSANHDYFWRTLVPIERQGRG
ncbi:MAG: MFS transporter, partial [Firmicutes bacterium]|nr:MFS transporter [Bacillota bacterium]